MLARPERASLQGFYLFARAKPAGETYSWRSHDNCAWIQYMNSLSEAERIPPQRWIHAPIAPVFYLTAPRLGEDCDAITWGALADRLEAAMVSAQ